MPPGYVLIAILPDLTSLGAGLWIQPLGAGLFNAEAEAFKASDGAAAAFRASEAAGLRGFMRPVPSCWDMAAAVRGAHCMKAWLGDTFSAMCSFPGVDCTSLLSKDASARSLSLSGLHCMSVRSEEASATKAAAAFGRGSSGLASTAAGSGELPAATAT